MNENQNNGQEFKREAEATVNQVKDSFKNVNVQEETNKAKNFFSGIFKAPVQTISGIAHDASNSFLKTGIILVVVWTILSVLYKIISIVSRVIMYGFRYLKFMDFLGIFLAILAPLITVILFSGITYFVHSKNNRKSFLTVTNTTVAAFVPFIITKAVSMVFILIRLIVTPVTKIPIIGSVIDYISWIDTPVNTILKVLSIILLFFGIKELSNEKEDGTIKKFFIIEAIYFVCAFLLGILKISIYII